MNWRRYTVGAAVILFLAVAYVVGAPTERPHAASTETATATGPTAAQMARAQYTKLRPDLDAHEYWTLRCQPYRDRAAEIAKSKPESMDAALAAVAVISCHKDEAIEMNSTASYRELFEKGNDGNRLAMPASIVPQLAAPKHVAADGCDMAGAIPNCKEEMAKLMASRH
jgi:hypothetical protein